MTFVVPFDGSVGSESALARASEIGAVLREAVLAVAIIPTDNTEYARSKGWLDADASFDLDAIVSFLADKVADVDPEATFEYEQTDREVTPNSIAKPIRRLARDNDASMVFIGSDNAGRLTTTLSSIGERISTDRTYDVVIVRQHPAG